VRIYILFLSSINYFVHKQKT